MAGDDLDRAATELTRRLRRWAPASWAVRAATGGIVRGGAAAGSRADAVHRTVQRLADLAAAAERRPPRQVPRLDDRILPDQLAVMAHDIDRSGDPATRRAALAELTALRIALGLR
jgi:hypothetical protein